MEQDWYINGAPNWRRPPMKCPQCMEVLDADRQPLLGLERYATRCKACNAMLRFVREDIAPVTSQGTNPAPVWVAGLLGDRCSRIAPRTLWEPCESGWQSLGGSGARTFGFVDPTRTLCDYPGKDERMRIEPRWTMDVSRHHATVSVTVANDELWAVTANGEVHVYENMQVNALEQSAPVKMMGSPQTLGMDVASPPATRGQWWMFQSTKRSMKGIYRNPQQPSVQDWPIYAYDLPSGWIWSGAPLAIDGRAGGPTFAGLAYSSQAGETALFVFEMPESAGSSRLVITPVQVPLADAINVPVQVPMMYAAAADTDEAAYRGHLVWVDKRGNLYAIDTALPVKDWAREQLHVAHAEGSAAGRAYRALPSAPPPTAGGVPQLPPPPPPPPPASLNLKVKYNDCLCVSVEPFAQPLGASGAGGVRVWSIQRHKEDANGNHKVAIRNFCIEGGPKAERTWQTVPQGTALSKADALGKGELMVSISMLPVYVDTPGTDAGQLTAHLAQILAVSSNNEVDVYTRQGYVKLEEPRAERLLGDNLACAPILTPYGLIALWEQRVETWTFPQHGTVQCDSLPGGLAGRHATSLGKNPPLMPIQTKRTGGTVYPAIIANRMWIPSDDGKVHCVDILPESSFTDKISTLETK